MEDAFPAAQAALGALFKKPKISEKLLNKPPFRFLHDVTMATINNVDTGFGQGLYSDEEQDSSNISDKSAKIGFLEKIITIVGICDGTNIDIRAAKVVAGLEPLNTSLFLAKLAEVAASEELDHAAAVQRALDGEEPGTNPPPTVGGGGEAKSDSRPAAAKSPAAESKGLDDEGAPSSFADAFQGGDNLAPGPVQGNDRAQSRAGTRGGGRDKVVSETSDAGLGEAKPSRESPAKDRGEGLDLEIEKCDGDGERLRAMIEPIVTKPKCSDKLLAKPPFRFLHDVISAIMSNTGFAATGVIPEEMKESGNVKEKSDKIDYLDAIIKHVGSHLNTLVDARPAKIVAGLEAENTVRFLQLLVLAATNASGGGDGDAGEAQAKGESTQPEPRGSPAKDVPVAYKGDSQAAVAEAKREDPAPVAAQVKEPSPVKMQQQEEEAKGESGAAEPKSMRPTTARRRPPKVKENAAKVVKEQAPVGVKNANIMKDGDDGDDDFFKDDDAEDDEGAKRVTASDLEGKNVSKLVQNIVREEEEAKRSKEGEEKVDDGKKGIRLNLNIKKSVGNNGLSTTDMEALLGAVQRLVTSTAPLGKCMDYVQEDLSQMSREGEKWQGEFRKKIDAYGEASRRTEEELDPLRATLRELDDQVKEQQEKIKGVKKNIFGNESRIKHLLRSVATN